MGGRGASSRSNKNSAGNDRVEANKMFKINRVVLAAEKKATLDFN